MPQENQDCQLYSSSSHHERTYSLSSQEFPKSIKAVNFIPAPATMRELTLCQAKNSPRASRLSASFQLQPPSVNLPSVKPKMTQEHQDCQLPSSSSQHQRTYRLSSQEYPKSIKTVSFIPALASIRKLTGCQAKNTPRVSRLSASSQLQLASENLLSVKPRIPQEHQDCQLYSSSIHHDRTYILPSQEFPKTIKTISFIPAPATMR